MMIRHDVWLRNQKAHQTFVHLVNYNVAIFGNAALQALHLGLRTPTRFWAAMARATSPDVSGAFHHNQASHTDASSITQTPSEAKNIIHTEAVTDDHNPYLLDEPRNGQADDLTSLNGIGPKLQSALNDFGIYHFDQIANLNPEGVAWLNTHQKGFAMTCERYDIIAQAKARI